MPGKILVIFGPTATGKTDLAINLAKEFNGELISADSRQVYKYMDVGSGKLPIPRHGSRITKHDGYWIQDGATIWGYDIVTPDVTYSAADFKEFAYERIKDILERGKIPIIVGGTGFYISAVLGEVKIPRVPPNPELREELSKLSAEELYSKLEKLDPQRAKTIQKENPRRLIRAIEIAVWRVEGGRQKAEVEDRGQKTEKLLIGLTAPRKFLYKRIDERAELMVEAGLTREIKNLLKRGYGWELSSMSGIGYRQFRPFLEGKSSLDACIEKLKYDTHAYARRQESYLKRFKDAQVYDITNEFFDTKVKTHVESWLRENQKQKTKS